MMLASDFRSGYCFIRSSDRQPVNILMWFNVHVMKQSVYLQLYRHGNYNTLHCSYMIIK